MLPGYEPGLASVIIPTRNRPAMTCEAVASCRSQTYRPIEVIVVDDGSSDDTAAAVETAARHDPTGADAGFTVRVLRQDHRGAPAARNRGLCESRGEFIQFLDSDDLLLPDKLQRQVEHLQSHPELMFNYTIALNVDAAGNVLWSYGEPMPAPGRAALISGYFWDTPAPLIRRDLCRRIGPWDEQLASNQELEYFSRLKALDRRGAFIPEPGHQRRLHDEASISQQARSRDALRWAVSRERALERMIALVRDADLWVAAERQVLARQLRLGAEYYALAGDRDGVRRCLRRSARVAAGLRKVRFAFNVLLALWFPLALPLYWHRRRVRHRQRRWRRAAAAG